MIAIGGIKIWLLHACCAWECHERQALNLASFSSYREDRGKKNDVDWSLASPTGKTSLSTCAVAIKVQITTTTDSQLSNGFLKDVVCRRVSDSQAAWRPQSVGPSSADYIMLSPLNNHRLSEQKDIKVDHAEKIPNEIVAIGMRTMSFFKLFAKTILISKKGFKVTVLHTSFK